MRPAVSSLLDRYCHVVGTAERGDQVLARTRELRPDVLVLDISLPSQTGLKLLPELRRQFPQLGIVMLTNQDQPVFREEAERRGADGYVLKDRAADELWPAIQNAARSRAAGEPRRSKRA